MFRKVQKLNKDNFAVWQHLKYEELFSNPDNYAALTCKNTLQMREELAPLINSNVDDANISAIERLLQIRSKDTIL